MGEFWGRLEVGWEKVVCWSTMRGSISETRKYRGKVTMEAYIGSHQRSFEGYHSRPSTPLSLDLRFATPAQNFSRYYLRNG